MLDRPSIRIRVLPDAGIAFTDPDPGTLALIRTFDPSFTVRSAPLPGFVCPRVLGTRRTGAAVLANAVPEASDSALWAAHDHAMQHQVAKQPAEASLLDVKVELARRMLRHCELCALRCGVDRLSGERGRCGLGTEAYVYEAYVHIAEEAPINPALNVSLRGCGMRCLFCQQAPALNARGHDGEQLLPSWWERLDCRGARSLVFVGGNPTESLPAVLDFLRAAPADFTLPIGWNCSGYDTRDAIRLLDGVVDVYIPDYKFAGDACATQLSEAPGYAANARSAISAMLRQRVPVIVRMLVLPGHRRCCHEPVLADLATLPAAGNLFISIQGTYLPEWKALAPNAPLSHRPSADEVTAVRDQARAMGFTLVE